MKAHYSCTELAALKLPGMPGNRQNWYELVKREGWQSIEVKAKGGKGGIRREYTPPAKIIHLIHSRKQIAAEGHGAHVLKKALALVRTEARAEKHAKTEASLDQIYATLSPEGRDKFEATFDIVLAFREYFKHHNADGKQLQRNAAFAAFAEDYNAKHINISDAVRIKYTTISPRSIQRWVLDNEKSGLIAYADRRAVKGGASERKSVIEQHADLEKYFIAVVTSKPHIQNTHLTQMLNELRVARFGADASGEILCPHISYSAVCRYRTRFEQMHRQALMAETNPDGWKNKFMSSMGSQDEDVRYLNQKWLMDGTPAEYDLTDGHHTASVVLDVWGRRPKILFSRTPRTETNKLLLRSAVLEWGVPDGVKIDNGTDYVSREMMMFFEEMGIDSTRCNAFSPWEKGHVERFIKTFLHSMFEVLDNFAGHNVAEKKVIEARRSFADNLFKKNAVVRVEMSCAEIQALADAWVDGTYMMTEHRTLEMTPFEKVASYTGAVKRISNERALDILLAKPLNRMPTITKKGIRFDKMEFIHAELPIHAGKLADIRLDPNDMGKIIVYVDGKFLCIASNAMLEGIDRKEVAAHGKAKQNAFVAEKKAEFRRARKSLPIGLHELAIQMITERAERAGKVTILAKKAEEHRTAALVEAERVLRAQETPQLSPEHALLMREARQMAAKARNPNPIILDLPTAAHATPLEGMNDEQKYALWMELDAAKEELKEAWQQRFHAGYPRTSAYRAQQAMHQEKSLSEHQL
jgi:putative transposase